MKLSNATVRKFVLAIFLGGLITLPASALEIIIEEDLVENVVVTDQLVRVADNAVFLFDTSSSMNEEFRDTGKSKIELVSTEFKKRASYFPEIGHNFGIYQYTKWKEYYPMQVFSQEKVGKALEEVPAKGSGPTPLKDAMEKLEDIIKPLSGRTAVFVFSDGEYTGGDPRKVATRLATTYDICFYVISTAKVAQNNALGQAVADLNACSRMIPLESFLNRPEYTSGALFDVIATEEIVTTTESRVVGLETKGINFAFDKTELNAADKSELDQLAEVMSDKPDSYAVIAGYTDNVGPEDYNEGLSRRRAEVVASYMTEAHGVDNSRMVLQWYGSDNPLVSNDTREGRATNRRVEMAVGGI